jgi:site-specific DNA-methyltransferase (adenine-specific)
MSTQANFTLKSRNPDVLTCIANLSNDEVFTPPELANQMLDQVAKAWAEDHNGANIWEDKNVKFLDPCTKSGVFLREITQRLTKGLEKEIPSLRKRVDHILTKQVFGIGITKLTSLLARRSVYCSKTANGEHSIAKSFDDPDGNIWFQRIKHSWDGDRCSFCGAAKQVFDRPDGLESHAYSFIHTKTIKSKIEEIFRKKMQFDVIIGNPPYQLQDASDSASASPIYQIFVEQAIALEPRYLTMVTPSRWFVGGKGLDEFRKRMLGDMRIQSIVDYVVDKDAFPQININGGVSYFLWSINHKGSCMITTIEKGGVAGTPSQRNLDEFDIFIRRNQAVAILRKVRAKGETTFDSVVSSRKPFGLPTNFYGAESPSKTRPIKMHCSGKITWVSKSELLANQEWSEKWKVLVGRATDGNEKYPLPIWDQRGPFVAGPGEACSETYLVASLASSKQEAEHIVSYMRTMLFRFLVSLRKMTQDNKADVFAFVPILEMDKIWDDKQLASRYKLSEEDLAFMREMIRDMEFSG